MAFKFTIDFIIIIYCAYVIYPCI